MCGCVFVRMRMCLSIVNPPQNNISQPIQVKETNGNEICLVFDYLTGISCNVCVCVGVRVRVREIRPLLNISVLSYIRFSSVTV